MSTIKPLTCSIHSMGLSPSRLCKVHSGEKLPILRRSWIALDLFCPVLSPIPKNSYMTFALQRGVWEGSCRKLTRPTACTAAAAQTFSLPLDNGEGRFLARAPTTCRIIWRYSSLRCFAQKASVKVVTFRRHAAWSGDRRRAHHSIAFCSGRSPAPCGVSSEGATGGEQARVEADHSVAAPSMIAFR